MSTTSREQFAQQVIEIVRSSFPRVQIARAEQPFAMRINGSVVSLENLYRYTQLRPEHVNEDVQRWMQDLLSVAADTADGGEPLEFEQVRDRVMPMVLPESSADPELAMIVSQPLVAELRVAYAVDSDTTISYVSDAALRRWGVSPDDLHEVALHNLVSRSEAISAHAAQDEQGIYLILFQTGDSYDASRILLPTLHERLRPYLGSPFVAGIPNRDILLCFRNDDETVTKLQEQISKDFRRMPHQRTDKLLLVTADGIAPRLD